MVKDIEKQIVWLFTKYVKSTVENSAKHYYFKSKKLKAHTVCLTMEELTFLAGNNFYSHSLNDLYINDSILYLESLEITLTENEIKYILFRFILGETDSAIANYLSVSPQAIYKLKTRLFRKIKKARGVVNGY